MLSVLDRSPFVGRQPELARLLDGLDSAGQGQGRVVLVAGEPRIGKTRLVLELAERARCRDWVVMFGRSYESEGMPPYLPFVEALQTYVQACPLPELQAYLGDGAAEVALLVRELRGRLPALRASRSLSPEHERYGVFESVSDFLLNIARAQPAAHGPAEAGCSNAQLDAPIVGILLNMGQLPLEQAAGLIAACFDGVNARKTVHICCGDLNGKPFSQVLRLAPWVELMQRLAGVVDVAHLECSYFGQWLEHESLAALPKGMELAAGIVDVKSSVEPVSKLRSRGEALARVVGADRLWLTASCGFGRRPMERAVAKMTNLVEAAASL